mgnify:CR=1 FL=1
MNSLTDKVIITKLYEASNAGVKIDLIIRGFSKLLSISSFEVDANYYLKSLHALEMLGVDIPLTFNIASRYSVQVRTRLRTISG